MKLFVVLLGLQFLSACTLIPGSHIDLNDSQSSEKTVDVDISVVSVDANVISQLNNERIQSPPKLPEVLPSDSNVNYKIGVGDVVTVIVWEHPELTSPLGQFRTSDEQGNVVYEDGTIFYPFAGKLKVAGKSVAEVRDVLTKRLTSYIENPQVDVRVSTYRSQKFVVSGDVNEPGVFPITNIPQRVLDAIGLAGGFNEASNLFDVTLTRNGEQIEVPMYHLLYKGMNQYNYLLQHGDMLHVAENNQRKVFVLGEVKRAQSVPMTNQDMSLTYALASVGGINELTANGEGLYVIRRGQQVGSAKVYQFDISQAYSLVLADQFQLAERDIVYVSAAPISRWNRLLSNLLPTVNAINVIDDVADDTGLNQ